MQNLLPKEINVDDRELIKIKSMIDSMTEKERQIPNLIDARRARRIAVGSGRAIKDVSELVKRFKTMRSMMGNLGKNMGGMMGKIPGMNTLSQMNQLRKMAQGGGMPSMEDIAAFGGGAGALGNGMGLKRVDRDKVKKARKAARKNRKKNRRK